MTLDSQLPHWDFNEVHSITVRATPEATMRAARSLTAREIPLSTGLILLRGLPGLLTGRHPRPSPTGPVLEQFEQAGFAVLSESDTELVMGAVGQFWRLGGNLRRIAPADFAGFDEPGYAKGAIDFVARPDGDGGCVLRTETRVALTDADARSSFARYWTVVRIGSGLIRREWLWAIRRRAEHA